MPQQELPCQEEFSISIGGSGKNLQSRSPSIRGWCARPWAWSGPGGASW